MTRPTAVPPFRLLARDLIASCGFNVLISMVLNVGRAGIPGGEAPPLGALK